MLVTHRENDEIIVDILSTIAATNRVCVQDLGPPLAEAIDPESFVELLVRSNSDVRISFEYADQNIVAESDGRSIKINGSPIGR